MTRESRFETLLEAARAGELVLPSTGYNPEDLVTDDALVETQAEALVRRHRGLIKFESFLQAYNLLIERSLDLDEFYEWAAARIADENTEHLRVLKIRLHEKGLLDDEEIEPAELRRLVRRLQRQNQPIDVEPTEEVPESEPSDVEENLSEGRRRPTVRRAKLASQ